MSLAVSKLGCCFSVKLGKKKSTVTNYRDELLMQLLPSNRSIANVVYIFQQENAPAGRARQTVQLMLRRETPEFTAPDMRSDARTSLPHAITGRGRSAAEVDDCRRRSN